MSEPILQRRFCIHGVGEAPSRAHLVEGLTFEDAALRFIEDHHPAPDDEDDVSLFVEDVETGQRQCFTINLGSGEAEPCD